MIIRFLTIAVVLMIFGAPGVRASSLVLPDHIMAEYAKGQKFKGGKFKAHKFKRGRAYGYYGLPGRRVGWRKRAYRPAYGYQRSYRPARRVYVQPRYHRPSGGVYYR